MYLTPHSVTGHGVSKRYEEGALEDISSFVSWLNMYQMLPTDSACYERVFQTETLGWVGLGVTFPVAL